MVVFIKCAVCCYTVAPRVNFSEEIIKYFELELELKLFCVPHVRTKSYGQRSFAYQGTNTWNQLPLSVRHSQSLASFKTKLKTHLFPK